MSILNDLIQPERWEEFYINRVETGHMSLKELDELRTYIDERQFLEIAEGVLKNEYEFSIPQMSYISKSNGKKRIVYKYKPNEVWYLKHLGFRLHRYDDCFSDACYSFRTGRNAKTAVMEILNCREIGNMYCLKADIHNYFNSIPRARLCEKLFDFVSDDSELVQFLTKLLSVDAAIRIEGGETVYGNRGAMAGTPISPFLANLYLLEVDRFFEKEGIKYLRYADDILIFSDSREKIEWCREELLLRVAKEGLTINDDKFSLSMPGQTWEFLGFRYDNGVIDISDNTKRKIKEKIRRKAHSIYRWRIKKNVSFEKAAFVLIRSFNCKFFDIGGKGDFSWSRWFFPLINTSESLKEIDNYLVEYIRYLYSGRHYKGNFRITYEQIKELGFRSLVNEYYS